MMSEQPVLLIFAGPNGSGKSTLVEAILQKMPSMQYINADDITKNIIGSFSGVSPEALVKANYQAAKQAEEQRIDCFNNKKSFATETVMSTPDKINLMREAKSSYRVELRYVTTHDSDINVSRVALRYEAGGHDVPEEKVRSRYVRSMALLPQAIQIADHAIVYDNSHEYPDIILTKNLDGQIELTPQKGKDSIWKLTCLTKIKEQVLLLEDKFEKINTAKPIDKIDDSTCPEQTYYSYSKAVIKENGGFWQGFNIHRGKDGVINSTDFKIFQKLCKKDFTKDFIQAVLQHSPGLTAEKDFAISEQMIKWNK